MSKKQSTQTITMKNTNSSSGNQSKNSKRKRNRQKPPQKPRPMAGPVVNVSINSARRLSSQSASTSTIKNGIRVKHTEMIGPVYKPTTTLGHLDTNDLYQVFRLRCNPGSQSTFDWLSTLSRNYEFYRFLHLSFYFETRSPTTSSGSIIISPDYDAADGQAALSEKHLFSNKGTVDDAVWKHLRCTLDPASMNRLYKSHANMSDERFKSSVQDQKTLDVAQVFVCVDSSELEAAKYGKLFVSYDVELTEPQAPSEPVNQGGGSAALQVAAVSGSTQPFSSSVAAASYFIDEGVLEPLPGLPNVTFPTAVVGRFLKDYSGAMFQKAVGTGLASGAAAYLGNDPNTPAGGAGDVSLPTSGVFNSLFNGTNTVHYISRILNAKAGDYLKMANPLFTTLTSHTIEMGGINLGNII